MLVEPLPFDARRFRTAAAHYVAGRPPYAPRLIARVAELCRLEPTHRVMDLGCGPGILAAAFAPYAAEVVGVDPEPEMLRHAAAQGTPPNVRWVEGSSYDLSVEKFGRFKLVTMGRSFHWMDRFDTLRRLDAMIEGDGAVVLFHDTFNDVPDNAWRAEWREAVIRYSAGDPMREHRREHGWVRHEAVLLDSVFCELEEISVIERRIVSVDTLVERALSMSSASRARIGDKADELAAEVRSLMQARAPGGSLAEVVSTQALIAWRSASTPEG